MTAELDQDIKEKIEAEMLFTISNTNMHMAQNTTVLTSAVSAVVVAYAERLVEAIQSSKTIEEVHEVLGVKHK